jgi:hypothetical protein
LPPHSKLADSSIAPLSIGLLRFSITPVSQLIVPAVNKGNMLRGGFGHAFRRLCCVPQCRDARSCPIADSCPYKQIFEPSPPPGAERLSKNQDIPRPFIFRPPHTTQTNFERDESFEFELVLIGRAFEYLPYFVLSFRELAEGGLGLNRARCKLDRVVAQTSICDSQTRHSTLLYSSQDQLFHSVKPLDSADWIKSRIDQLTSDNGRLTTDNTQLDSGLRSLTSVTLAFLSPTHLKSSGQAIREPEFHHIFKRLRDRLNALSTFFGEGPLDMDFRGFGERSEKIKKVRGHFEWLDRARTSTKTGQRHELSGFVGEATYEGDLEEFLPWLVMGELVHVGKHTPWGNGMYAIES